MIIQTENKHIEICLFLQNSKMTRLLPPVVYHFLKPCRNVAIMVFMAMFVMSLRWINSALEKYKTI